MSNRFRYVDYDGPSAATSGKIRKLMAVVEHAIMELPESRPRSLALTKLEESFMWVGKAIRDTQDERDAETREAEWRDKQKIEDGVCLRCGEDIEEDRLFPDNERLCGYCDHMTGKDD